MIRKHSFWYVPSKVNNNKRSASLLELFFDLVFVALLSGFVHRVEHIFESSNGFDGFSFAFVFLSLLTATLVWRTFTVFSSYYEYVFNIRHRVMTFMLMFGMLIITVSLFIDFGHHEENLRSIIIISSIGYTIVFVVLMWMYLSAGLHSENKYEKKRLIYKFLGILVASLITAPAVLININSPGMELKWTTIGLWGIALVSWMAIDWFASTSSLAANTPDISLEHLQERFGIIFIVFIGESIVQAVAGSTTKLLSDTAITVANMLVVFIILFSWWWWFNDTINYPNIINHPKLIAIYKTSLLIILMSLSLAAVGFSGFIKDPSSDYPKWMLGAGMIAWAFGNSTLFMALKDYNRKDRVLFPRILRKAIYWMPVWGSAINCLAFLPVISTSTFVYIVLVQSSLLIPLSIAIITLQRRVITKRKIDLDKKIRDYYKKEEKWIRQYIVPKMDVQFHKENNYEINHFSKYLQNSKPLNKKKK